MSTATSHIKGWWNPLNGTVSRTEREGLVPLAPVPQFDVMSTRQEELSVKFSTRICGGACLDPVSVLEMAEDLYLAEMELYDVYPKI